MQVMWQVEESPINTKKGDLSEGGTWQQVTGHQFILSNEWILAIDLSYNGHHLKHLSEI